MKLQMIVARETEKIKGCALENERESVVQPLPPALRILRQQLLRHKELAAVEAVGAGEHPHLPHILRWQSRQSPQL